MKTKFSIIISNYNYKNFLKNCIESALYQDYPFDQFEVVCIDDGSTDDSWSLIQNYKSQAHFRPFRNSNKGLEKTCNFGIQQAKYDRIIRLDADDKLNPNLLSLMDLSIRKNPQYDFYYCQDYIEYFSDDEKNQKTLPPFDPQEIFERGDFLATGTVYKKSDLKEVGFFPEEVKNCGLENYSVILELIHRGKVGLGVPGSPIFYRRHKENMSTVKRNAIVQFGRSLLKRYGREFKTNVYHPYGLKLEPLETFK